MKQNRISFGKFVSISNHSKIGDGTVIGNNVTVYDNVIIGRNVTIFDGAVLGRPPKSTTILNRKPCANLPPLSIGDDSIIGANCVLYTGSAIGNNVLIGDLASIREECNISNDVVIGRSVLVMYNSKIGTATRIIDGSIITGNSIIEEHVFIGPGVISINDNSSYTSRFNLSPLKNKGPIIKKYALIGAGANLNANITIGEGSIVAPNAMVIKDVKPWTMVAGIPAHYKYKINQIDQNRILKHSSLKKY